MKSKIIVIAAISLAFCQTSKALEPEKVPEKMVLSAQQASERIREFTGGKKCFTLTFVTDVHSGGNYKYKQFGFISELDKYFHSDLLVNGGDIGLNYTNRPGVETLEYDHQLVSSVRDNMDSSLPWLSVKGNHDMVFDQLTYGSMVNSDVKGAHFGDQSRLYGYIDFPKHKMRVIFVNTSDNDNGSKTPYFMSDEQLNHIEEYLQTLPKKWKVIVTGHFCTDPIGAWVRYQRDCDRPCFDRFNSILACFAAIRPQDLVCYLCGDSHFDNTIVRSGVRYVIRQGYGGIDPLDIPEGASTTPCAWWNGDSLYDVLVIRKDGQAKLFRVGAGGPDCDLLLTDN